MVNNNNDGGFEKDQFAQDQYEQPQQDSGLDFSKSIPKVGADKKKATITLGIIGLVVVFILYSIFSGGGDEDINANNKLAIVEKQEVNLAPPPLAPPPPPPPPSAPVLEEEPQPQGPTQEEIAAMMAKIQSPMLIAQRGVTPPQGIVNNYSFDPANSQRQTDAEGVVAGVIGDLDTTIAQGKVIDAVLETGISTDLPGSLRAIISRDIFAEAGKEPIIPKGSRVVGTYNSDIARGQNRVFIIWNRVILPNGIDAQINSPGIDNLGRSGVEGKLDSKYFEMFQAAMLTTALTIGTGLAADGLVDDNTTTTTNSIDSTVSQSGSPGSLAALDATKALSDIGKVVLSDIINLKPTITIDQGTRIKIFVNRDITFPPEFTAVSTNMVF